MTAKKSSATTKQAEVIINLVFHDLNSTRMVCQY